MSVRERNKGARGELEVLELVRARWPRATRNFASGAAGNGDIAHGPEGVCLEVVATRWDRGPWLAVLELDELLDLLELREKG